MAQLTIAARICAVYTEHLHRAARPCCKSQADRLAALGITDLHSRVRPLDAIHSLSLAIMGVDKEKERERELSRVWVLGERIIAAVPRRFSWGWISKWMDKNAAS